MKCLLKTMFIHLAMLMSVSRMPGIILRAGHAMDWNMNVKRALESFTDNEHDVPNFHIQIKTYDTNKMLFPTVCAQSLPYEMPEMF